ncbi:MAG: hypothetical protein GW913_05115 [Myxococcales bacterium]|nr:hypothetical protein [Myxococcales bacterium]
MSQSVPTSLPASVDLVVVGAGTAGAALAGAAAARGLSVLCLERGDLGAAGARWVNGVSDEAFIEAGVPLPTGEELLSEGGNFHLLAGWGPERIVIDRRGLYEVDMRLLVARLQARALEAGARLEGGVRVDGIEGRRVSTSAGPVEAEFIVDASGLSGARLLAQPKTPPSDICSAAQGVYALKDVAAAKAFLAEHEVGEDETLCFAAVEGGYSILNISLHGDELSILTGSIPADGHASGAKMIERFLAEHEWVGRRRFGGSRAIPLGRPHDLLAKGSVAVLGDSARQVFSAHGSGIGPGLVAARMLAEALAEGRGCEGYALDWMRSHGGVFAGYDSFRRFSQRLGVPELLYLMRTGLMDPDSAGAALVQRFPRPSPGRALSLAPAIAGSSRLRPRLISLGAGIVALTALYARYPEAGFKRDAWLRAVQRVHGGAA